MKRIACLMLVLSIASAGCQDSSTCRIIGDEVKKVLLARIDNLETALESQIAELRENITKLEEEEEELSQIKIGLKALRDKIIELETALESQKTELRADIIKLEGELNQTKDALLTRINKLETALESQIAELRENITKLEQEELSQIKEALKPVKALPDRIKKLETALESQHAELKGDIRKLEEEELSQIKIALKPVKALLWWTPVGIATIIIALIAGGVAVHRSRKDTKIRKSNQGRQDPNSTDELPDKETLLDLSIKNPGSMFEHEYSGLGLLGHWLSWILDTRFPREVRNDWLRVAAMHCRIVERIFSEAADPQDKSEAKADTKDKSEAKVESKDKSEAKTGPEDKLTRPEKLSRLTISRDCLCAARITHVLAEAWRYVNQASEILSQVAAPEECSQLAERFLEWEPSLNENLKDIFKESLVEKFEKNRKAERFGEWEPLLNENQKDIFKEPLIEKLEKLEKNRKDAKEDCAKMIRTHSRQWALINQANLFRICIIRNVTFVFLVSLIVMLLATKFVITEKLLDGSIRLPYLYIAIYGWFGAALSILLAARKLKPSAVNFRTLWFSLLLRLALGAGGAFVTYVVVRTTGILSTSLLDSFQKIPGFIALGIAGGFSERLFQRVLEMFTKRIVPSKNDEGSEKVD
ncbi:MAG: hypothetical protein GY774_04590 [Planctomycetes bacterium]|nr:hypothetical protein [Planctomycetota bacterium]